MEHSDHSSDRSGELPLPSTCFHRLHAHVPLPYLRKKLPLFLEHSLNPEIYFNHRSLESLPEKKFIDLAADLAEHGRKATIHGPFHDLSPGAVDTEFRLLTIKRISTAMMRASYFAPDCIVFHPGFDPLRFGQHRELWLRNSLRTWKQLLPLAETMASTWILMENIFEQEPSTLKALLEELPSPPFGFCFDVGHFQVFSEVTLDEWLSALGPFLREVHLHDNDGGGDDHLPPGQGTFDFPRLFQRLSSLPQKIIGTIEAHSESDMFIGLDYLAAINVRS